ncbi:GCN5-related N-acetyltransferase [Geitlerinema sp. FC II]|uniref:GNAT family N-acetyltransferase n=1 Tax=Baaleninema simplex TaxID=2862350 RepID=UPI0003490C35|nr:GNAT family N-acetyltransferase [Baaleninema simplex]MDC0834867.1 GNAT family N-acetyltransferase [Geitlerinema sp. CS-897]PPT08746.1 GCN5-related N-acetyltransferase [Geitlerinema sp. FC II]
MNASAAPPTASIEIRPIQFRDLEEIETLLQSNVFTAKSPSDTLDLAAHLDSIRHSYGLLKFLSWFPNPYQNLLRAYVAQRDRQILGAMQVSPLNRAASTWRVDRAIVDPAAGSQDTGTALLRHCLQTIWEARTWIVEVDVNDRAVMALYRHNGFQPLAQMTYWTLEPEQLEAIGQREPDLPNLTPVSNSDAHLLYQLDTVSMPPLVRQVFDRHISDFKTSLFGSLMSAVKQWFGKTEVVSGYVFEPQRKAAIGYFQIRLSHHGKSPHEAKLTVHPAYTWLYPELLAQMARIVGQVPPQSLRLSSTDYQPEREEYLTSCGAEPIAHTLLMSRSVWHKLRETKQVSLEGLQLSDVLGGLQPSRKPVPGRMMWFHEWSDRMQDDRHSNDRSSGDRGGNDSEPSSDRDRG